MAARDHGSVRHVWICDGELVQPVPTIRDNLHASTAQMSILLLGLSVGSIAGLSLAPAIVNRWGTRRGLSVSIAMTGLGLLLTGIATDTVPSLAGGCAALTVLDSPTAAQMS